jgi:hypothetical protein
VKASTSGVSVILSGINHAYLSVLPGRRANTVSIDDMAANNRTAEEQIRARLRELTDELRQMRRKITEPPERSSANNARGRRLPRPPRPPASSKR